jgi:hypothetical protein
LERGPPSNPVECRKEANLRVSNPSGGKPALDSAAERTRRWLLGAVGRAVAFFYLGGVARAVDRLAKRDVDYRDRPKGGERCDNCRVWVPPNGCKSVEGEISPRGWCNIWRSMAANNAISPDADGKLTKNDVAYQPSPRRGQRCDNCEVFLPPDACNSVQGKISPKGWCNIWRAGK